MQVDRPDVHITYLSSRATSMVTPLLTQYRERLCAAGFGPYMGLNVPSSGTIAVYMLLRLCARVTVYGFGVKHITDIQNMTAGGYGYHYYRVRAFPGKPVCQLETHLISSLRMNSGLIELYFGAMLKIWKYKASQLCLRT